MPKRPARLKRRRAAGLLVTELQHHKPAQVQTLPLPSRSANSTTTSATDSNNYRTFDDITSGDSRAFSNPFSWPEKQRRPEVGTERPGAACDGHVAGRAAGATTTEKKKTGRRQRRWRRHLLSSETVSGRLAGSIPKLALLPQKARNRGSDLCRGFFFRGH